MELAKRVARNIVYRTAAQVVANISGLFVAIYLARVLKPEMFGVYSLAISIAMIAITIANLGIDGAISRYIAYTKSKGDIKALRGYFRFFLKLKLILILPVCFCLIILSDPISKIFNSPELRMPVVFASLLVLFTTLSRSLNAFFTGLQKFEYVFLRQSVYEVSRWAFIFLLVGSLLASGAILANALGRVVAFLLLLFVLVKSYRHYILGNASKIGREAAIFAGYMSVAQLGAIIYSYIDILMIGVLLSTVDVGYYRAASNLIFVAASMIAMSDIFLPLFTQLEGKDLENAFRRISRYTSVLSLPIAITGYYFASEIISVIYGKEYLSASMPFSILSFALVPMAYGYIISILPAKGKVEYNAYIIIASIFFNLVLNYILILKLGIAGAAIATLLSRIFTLIIAYHFTHTLFSLRLDINTLLKPASCSLVMFCVFYFLPQPSNLLIGILELLVGIAIYFSLLFAVRGLRKEDVDYFLKIFLKNI